MMKMRPLILIIMDGWGVGKEKEGNAIALAETPNFDRLKEEFSYTELETSGPAVGLMKEMMGGSEVGHLDIGAGRVVKQNVIRVNEMIKDESFFKNSALLKATEKVKKENSTLHFMGLLSDSGVHSYDEHLFALLRLARIEKIEKVFIHVFTDGRDTPIKSAEKYIKRLKKNIVKEKVGKIGTIIGRYYAMDRDRRWKRTKKAYLALTEAKGNKAGEALEGIQEAYKKGQTDEFIEPIILNDFQGIKDRDAVVFFNYRADRARQLTQAFLKKDFKYFPREKKEIVFVTLTQYYKGSPAVSLLPPIRLNNTLGEVLSRKGIDQLRVAETEKYAHVTYFLNGMREKPFPKEDRKVIPSPKVSTYDLKPEMSAFKLKEVVLEALDSCKYGVIILNFANPDMVGHTGKLEAAIQAVEVVDGCLGEIVKKIQGKEGIAVITADHGNAEEMIDPETKEPLSEHSKNPVPFIIVDHQRYILKKGKLANIAPTVLDLLRIEKPKEMTTESLIVRVSRQEKD